MMSVFTLTFLFSCGEDEEDVNPFAAPSLTVTAMTGSGTLSNGGEVTAGDSVEFTIDVTAAGGFNTLFVSGSLTAQVNRNDLNLDAGATAANDIKIGWIDITTAQVGSTASIKFVASDDANQTDTVDFIFTIVAPASPAVTSFETILLGAQGNSEEGFYNALEDIRYSYAEARDASGVGSSTVDFAYYFGATNGNTLAAIDDTGLNSVYSSVSLPIDGIFATRNSTTFTTTTWTAAEFDGVATNADLVAAASFEVGSESSARNLSNDQVVAFQFAEARGGAFGLIKISSIDDTNGNGTITIEVKVPTAE